MAIDANENSVDSRELSAFETDALKQLLSGSEPYAETLRAQFKSARVADREFTHHGFFTTFDTSAYEGPVNAAETFVLGDACARIAGLEPLADLLLFIRDGRIDLLECVSYETFPQKITNYEIKKVEWVEVETEDGIVRVAKQ